MSGGRVNLSRSSFCLSTAVKHWNWTEIHPSVHFQYPLVPKLRVVGVCCKNLESEITFFLQGDGGNHTSTSPPLAVEMTQPCEGSYYFSLLLFKREFPKNPKADSSWYSSPRCKLLGNRVPCTVLPPWPLWRHVMHYVWTLVKIGGQILSCRKMWLNLTHVQSVQVTRLYFKYFNNHNSKNSNLTAWLGMMLNKLLICFEVDLAMECWDTTQRNILLTKTV